MPSEKLIQISQALEVSYDWRLVILSLVIAIVSSYTALDLARQVRLVAFSSRDQGGKKPHRNGRRCVYIDTIFANSVVRS